MGGDRAQKHQSRWHPLSQSGVESEAVRKRGRQRLVILAILSSNEGRKTTTSTPAENTGGGPTEFLSKFGGITGAKAALKEDGMDKLEDLTPIARLQLKGNLVRAESESQVNGEAEKHAASGRRLGLNRVKLSTSKLANSAKSSLSGPMRTQKVEDASVIKERYNTRCAHPSSKGGKHRREAVERQHAAGKSKGEPAHEVTMVTGGNVPVTYTGDAQMLRSHRALAICVFHIFGAENKLGECRHLLEERGLGSKEAGLQTQRDQCIDRGYIYGLALPDALLCTGRFPLSTALYFVAATCKQCKTLQTKLSLSPRRQ